MGKKKVLFVCVHNSARSQMAEAFLKKHGGNQFEVFSAGLEAGILNPIAVMVMNEVDIDISKNTTDSVFKFYESDKIFDYVVTVCDEGNAGRCPVFPGIRNLHWSFADPSSFSGTREEKLTRTRGVRDQIEDHIKQWLAAFA